MPATSANSRSARPTRTRLPLTPKVTSSRRGGHVATRLSRTPAESAPVGGTPAMHLTPNVIVTARGGLSPNGDTRLSDATQSRALDMRGLRL